MARTHTFKGSASAGYGYFAYIEEGQLVIGEDWGREGGVLYRGPYEHAQIIMSKLRSQAPKLANSIDKYYFDEAKKIKISDAPVKEETIIHQFKDSRDCYGYGYHGYIENGELVICYEAPREGGVLYRGSYKNATKIMEEVKRYDQVLYNDIEKYFRQKRAKTDLEKLKKDCGFDEETKTILFKVKIYNKNGAVHNCLVRGRFQADVIKKLMPSIPEVLTIETCHADVFAIRSSEISAAEFVDKWDWED